MKRASLFLKIEIEFDVDESPQRIGDEICRQIMKMYGVQGAEVSSLTTSEE